MHNVDAHFDWQIREESSLHHVNDTKTRREEKAKKNAPKREVPGLSWKNALLLLGELLRSDVVTSQLDIEHTLHRSEDFLVGSGSTPFEVRDDTRCRVALGGEFLLCHLVGLLIPALLDRLTDLDSHGLGLDNVIAAVNLRQVLALSGTRTSSLFILR